MRLSLACAKRAPAQTSHEFWTASRERLGGLEGDSSLSSRLSIYVYGQNLDYGVMRNLDYPPPKKWPVWVVNVIQNLDYPYPH